MIRLSELKEGDVIWHPVIRRIGDTVAPSAASFAVCEDVHDDPTHFLTLVDENERQFTIGIVAPNGSLQNFFRNEIEAVKVAVMLQHDHSPVQYNSGNITTPESWIINMAKSHSLPYYNTVLLSFIAILAGFGLYDLFFSFFGMQK